MGLKLVPLIFIVLLFMGCTFQPEEKAPEFKIQYSKSTSKVFADYSSGHPADFLDQHFDLPRNGTTLFVNLTWDASQEPIMTDNGTKMMTHNFTYHLVLSPPIDEQLVCSPSNDVVSSTDLVSRTGSIRIKCGLNLVPGNISVEAEDLKSAEQAQLSSYIGAGTWYMNITSSPWFRCGNSQANSRWTLSVELESYHYRIERV